MSIVKRMRHMTWRQWLGGALDSAVTSGAGGIILMIVDPSDFNPFGDGDTYKLGKVCVALALVGLAQFVTKHRTPLAVDGGAEETAS
jgi:hypothetical protein